MENKILRKLVAFMLLIAMNINMFGTNLMLDPNSQHNTKLDTSANGTPIINISTPNSRGVSINEFLEYNVGHEGQILNNADNMGRSHIAGMINANPNLGPNQAANLIILQVNGANRSQIEGYIEALSRNRVDVVLSNENGIYLNGAGTINVRKFTPATGRVTLKDGDVVGIDVEKGRVVIGANGFDATNTDYVNIIAKSLELQGNLVGNRVDVILGENFVDNNGAVTSKGGINSVAIDAGNLGSMYAGQVRIVSTDKGAGVNSGALIYSKNEKLEITADGKINVAKIKGNGIEIKGSDYTQTELASSDRDINITANTVKLAGQTQAVGNVGLNADVENASEILTNGNLKTKKLTNTGKVKVLKKVEITGELDNGGSLISADGVTVTKDVKNTGEISTNDDFTAKNVVSSGKVFGKNIQADDVDNSGKMLAKGKFTAKNVKNTGEIASGDKISAKKLENSGTAATSSDISVSDSLVNHNGGNIEGKNVEVKGPELRNAGKISAGNIRSKVNEVINSGQVHSSKDVDFDTQKLTNTGEILAVNDVNSANADVMNNGKIASNNKILLDNSKITNTGEILSGDISMQNAQKFDNTGTIKANNTVLTTTQDINLDGNLHGQQRLIISGRNITNNGNTTGTGLIQITSNDFTNNRDISSDTVIINGQGNIVNNAMITGDNGKISGNDITNNDLIAFEKYLEINAQNKVQNNKDKTIYGGQTLIIKGNEILNDEGEILGGNMDLNAGKIVNNVGTIQATGDILITSSDFQNVGRVSNLDKYEKYYETWDGIKLSENEVNNEWIGEIGNSWTKRSTGSRGKKARKEQKGHFENIIKTNNTSRIKSLLLDKYGETYWRNRLGGGYPLKQTDSTDDPERALKGILKSNATTEYGKVLASGNITINSGNVKNKDSIISGGGVVNINSPSLENSVTTGNAVNVKYGIERMDIDISRPKKRRVRMAASLTRFLENGAIAYEAGQPSIIEGSVVNITVPVITSPITEANGKINIGSVAHGVAGSLFTGTVGKGISSANGTVQVVNNMSSVQSVLNTGTISVNPLLTGAMFTQNMNPGSKYLLETRSKYVDLNKYYGSDYFLSRLGYTPGWNRVRRLGDAYYENQLITRALTERLGTAFINGKSNEELIKSLMDNAGMESSRLGLQVGKELTPEQISGLSKDLVWYVAQNVNGVEVLVPKIYLSRDTLATVTADGRNKIGGVNGTYIKTDNFVNNGMKIGNGGVTYVQANTVRNETATNLLSEITGDRTFIHSDGNIENIGGRISGNEAVALISDNGKVTNDTTKRTVGYYNGEFDRTKHEEVKSLGTISSKGTVFVKADSYESTGGMLSADHLALDVNKVNLNALSLSGEDKFGSGGSNFNRYAETTHLGAGVSANTSSGTVGDMNLKGSSFIAEDTTGLTVTGNVKAESTVNIYENESRSTGKGFMSSSSSYRNSHTEENSASNLMLGKNAVIKGNIEGIGSNIVLGENTYVGGKVTTDSRQLHNSYFEENKKKGFSGGISHGTASLSYGKSQNSYDEKSTVNAKSNLQVGDGSVLNRGAEITATNFEYGNIQINNGDVKYGARIDTRDVHTESKSSSFGISAGVNSPMLDRAKQVAGAVEQVKNGDTAGGAMEAINAATGTIKGLSENITKPDGTRATINDIRSGNFKVNNDFYVSGNIRAGFNKSKSSTTSHTESAVVTTMQPMNENSSITYSNVNNITYQGTQAQGGTFIYNNVANIQKEAVELRNRYSSESSGFGVGVSAGIGSNGQIKSNGISGNISANRSNQSTDETLHHNGSFTNVNEVHNNTGTMTLSGFNQEGGKVTGNIGKVEVISRQNTSTTTGSSKGVNLGISANGVPSSVTINASRTNGNRAFVDNQSSFVVGEGSNLHVGTVENTGAVISKEGNSTFKIDTYVGKDIQNYDTMTTTGGSIGASLGGKPKITNVGFNQDSRDKQGITRNTVVGDVEIAEAEGSPINRDLGKANEVTKDTHSSTNINVEPQVIEYISNPTKFKEDLEVAILEGKATGETVLKSIENIVNGGKEDIGDPERRAINEIKEAVIRVKTAPQMESIAKAKDLNSPDVLKELDIAAIEKYDPYDPNLPIKVRQRVEKTLKDGKIPGVFYDEITNKIFVYKGMEDDLKIRAGIAREWKISEDLKNEKGKPNEEGRLKATVAGELAYDDMMKRGREGKTESISTDRFADAVMDVNSEVTADNLWDKGKALFAKTLEDGKQLAAGLKKDAKKLKAEAEYQFRKAGNNVIALKEQYIDKNPKKANETRQKIKTDRSETTKKKKQYDAEAKEFKDKSDKRKQQIDRDLKTKEENDRQQKIRKEKQLKEERDEIDRRSRKQHEDTRVITEQEKEYIEYVLKNKDRSSIFEGYDVQIIGKSGDNYIIKETSKPIFRTGLPQQYQYMNFKYPTLNEIRKEVYEGRAISSPGFFVVGYGVTPERADANRDSKTKALVNGIAKTGIGGYRVIKGGGLVVGGAATCPETAGVGCGVAAVGAANVGFGISDGIEGFQELGYAFSGKGNTLTTGNAITEFEQIKKGKNPQVKNGIKAFNPLKYVMGEENYDYWNMTSAMALPHAISYNSIFNSPSSTESSTQNKVTKTLINENKMLIEDNNGKAVIQKTPSGYISGYGRYNNKFIFGEKKVAPAISLESSNVENSVSLTVVKNEVTVFNPAVNDTPVITGGNALNLPPLYISGTTRTEGTKLNIEKITQPSRNLVEPKVVETQKDSKPVTVRKVTTNIEEADSKDEMKLKLNLQLFASKTPVIRIDELNQAIDNRGSGYFQKLQNSKQYGYTPSDEYYANLRADRNVGNVTAPIDFDNHIIGGEINRRGDPVGGHSTLTSTVRISNDLGVTSNGVRKNNIEIFNSRTNQWLPKRYINTMFPEWWTENRIKVENDAAYKLRTQHPTNQSKWEGITPSGIKVEGFEYPRTTVFPKENQ